VKTKNIIKKPKLKLIGMDGNALNLLGLARKSAKRAGWSKDQTAAVINKAMDGDYHHLLGTLMEHFDVE